ncbi:hypothetical protein RFI_36616 [Reticulomyxa filosa]|uniref:Uncharacterized protein n=1 Tax=Reticulomyxa filosa TaxID=46433 RepID=X6LGW2_RETFI|nr:hypothetical protein RFI_36616 [Reticulomyxa filosa]|eukprot:ETO00824.1 hypothetical protein RFI_36616 [Reticulomyxa filosa]
MPEMTCCGNFETLEQKIKNLNVTEVRNFGYEESFESSLVGTTLAVKNVKQVGEGQAIKERNCLDTSNRRKNYNNVLKRVQTTCITFDTNRECARMIEWKKKYTYKKRFRLHMLKKKKKTFFFDRLTFFVTDFFWCCFWIGKFYWIHLYDSTDTVSK